jgi:AbrB family looped-hinge helix DNA binding protein
MTFSATSKKIIDNFVKFLVFSYSKKVRLWVKILKEKAMSTTRIGPKHQITIPKDIFETLNLEVGDFLEAGIEDNTIVLVPKKLIPKDQAWFWTKEWQKGEREADEAIRKGDLMGPFSNIKNALKALKKKR